MKIAQPLYAEAKTAAKLMDMPERDFLRLVDDGHLPRPIDIGGFKRWSVDHLNAIAKGEAAIGMDGVSWTD